MANAIDYLDWRGDVPMSISPFNEVDGLIAAKLTSLDFTGIVPSEGGAALRDAVDAYFERYGDKDVLAALSRKAGVICRPSCPPGGSFPDKLPQPVPAGCLQSGSTPYL